MYRMNTIERFSDDAHMRQEQKARILSYLDERDLNYVKILTEEINGLPYDENLLYYYNDKSKHEERRQPETIKITVKRKVLVNKKLIDLKPLGEIRNKPKSGNTDDSFDSWNIVHFPKSILSDNQYKEETPNYNIKDNIYKMPTFRKIPKISQKEKTRLKQVETIVDYFRRNNIPYTYDNYTNPNGTFNGDLFLSTYNNKIDSERKIKQRENRRHRVEQIKRELFQNAIEANQRNYEKGKFRDVLKEFRNKKEEKAKTTISKFLVNNFNRKRAVVPLEDTLGLVINKLGLRNTNKPFVITLHSWKANIKKTYKFNDVLHFEHWVDKILNSGEVKDYEYIRKYQYGQPELLNLFSNVRIGTVKLISGGCNKDIRCVEKTITTPHYTFSLYNPISRDNNCLFHCLNKIIGQQVDIKKLRKQFNIPAKTTVDIQTAYKIIKESTDKNICIIDHETNEELDDDATYILIKNEHYYVVEKFEEKNQQR